MALRPPDDVNIMHFFGLRAFCSLSQNALRGPASQMVVQHVPKSTPSSYPTWENMYTENFADEKCRNVLLGRCSFGLMDKIKNRFWWSCTHKGHQKGKLLQNFSPALWDLKDVMACNCAGARMPRCSFPHLSVSMSWVIANNPFATGQIIFILKAKRKKSNK